MLLGGLGGNVGKKDSKNSCNSGEISIFYWNRRAWLRSQAFTMDIVKLR